MKPQAVEEASANPAKVLVRGRGNLRLDSPLARTHEGANLDRIEHSPLGFSQFAGGAWAALVILNVSETREV